MKRRIGLLGLICWLGFAGVSTTVLAFDGPTWIRTYAGGYGHNVYDTPDGGAILAGTYGAGFDCCRPWLIKLAPDGSVEWHRTYEAAGLAGANNIVPTQDGGYVLSGDGTEFRVVKLRADGTVQWGREYGDGGYTHLRVLETGDGEILVTGATQLGDGASTNGRAVLLDANGVVIWQKVYGRPFIPDYLTSAVVAHNGNFLTIGSSRGSYWVMELDRATGDIVWQNLYGGGLEDTALVVTPLPKGNNYLVVGASESFTEGGNRNWWAVILRENGKLWKQFSLGGLDAEDPHSVIATSDGGFMIGGGTGSFGAGFSDIWLVKFDSRQRVEWQKAYGKADRTDSAWQIQETSSGYTVIGDSYFFPETYDIWLMTLDGDGNIEQGTCGTVTDTAADPRRTRATTQDAGCLTWDAPQKAVDMRVDSTLQTFSLETCGPE